MANQFSVTPLGGLDVGARMTSIIEGGRQQNRIKQMREKAPEIFATGDPTQIASFMVEYPEMAQTMERATGVENTGHKKEIVDMAKGLLTPGADPKEVLAQYANTLQQSRRDPKMAVSMLSKIMADPNQAIDMGKKLLAIHSPAEFTAYQKATAVTGVGGEANVKSSDILEDGTVVQSTTTGVRVFGPEGNLLKGKDAASAIKRARAEKVSNLRLAAGGKKEASLEAELELKGLVAANVIGQEEAVKISVKAYDRLEKINKNIANIDEGIKLLNEGANTGQIDKYLPSIKANSIKLDNLAGRLGLDIISAVTFGALSESELKFAIDTALPQGLQPEQLKQWLIEKKTSQEKLADYLEASAIYLGSGTRKDPHTVTKWIEKGRQKRLANALPEGLTEDTITFNMEKYGKTREQVIKKFSGGK